MSHEGKVSPLRPVSPLMVPPDHGGTDDLLAWVELHGSAAKMFTKYLNVHPTLRLDDTVGLAAIAALNFVLHEHRPIVTRHFSGPSVTVGFVGTRLTS